jgi:Zn-dependent protease with chaperone function
MFDKKLEGWYTDPFGRHESRWMSRGTPTQLVRDGIFELTDPVYDEPFSVSPQKVDGPARIVFAPASQKQQGDVRRAQFGAAYFAAGAIWALGVAVAGEPVYGTIAALVLIEVSLYAFRASRLTGRVIADERVIQRVSPLLLDLCAKAACTPPRVVVRSDALLAAAVRRRRGHVDLLLSQPFTEDVNDQQLKALIAHEVIHIVHRDFFVVRTRGMVALLAGLALGVIGAMASGGGFNELPVFLAGMMAGVLLINALLGPLSRHCEVRADVEGAQLSGDACALAEALTVANTQSKKTRERLNGHPPWSWLLLPMTWRFATHPRMASRVARLWDLAA